MGKRHEILTIEITFASGKSEVIGFRGAIEAQLDNGFFIDTMPEVGEAGFMLHSDGSGWQYVQLSETECTPHNDSCNITWKWSN